MPLNNGKSLKCDAFFVGSVSYTLNSNWWHEIKTQTMTTLKCHHAMTYLPEYVVNDIKFAAQLHHSPMECVYDCQCIIFQASHFFFFASLHQYMYTHGRTQRFRHVFVNNACTHKYTSLKLTYMYLIKHSVCFDIFSSFLFHMLYMFIPSKPWNYIINIMYVYIKCWTSRDPKREKHPKCEEKWGKKTAQMLNRERDRRGKEEYKSVM